MVKMARKRISDQCCVRLKLIDALSIANIRMICVKVIEEALPSTNFFRYFKITGSCWDKTIGDRNRSYTVGRMEILGSLSERQRFSCGLETCKITRICTENHWSVTGL